MAKLPRRRQIELLKIVELIISVSILITKVAIEAVG